MVTLEDFFSSQAFEDVKTRLLEIASSPPIPSKQIPVQGSAATQLRELLQIEQIIEGSTQDLVIESDQIQAQTPTNNNLRNALIIGGLLLIL